MSEQAQQSAEYVAALREAANRRCARKAMLRLGFGDNCMHCLAVQRLAQIDGTSE